MKNKSLNPKKIRKIVKVGIASLAFIIPLTMTEINQANTNIHADAAHPTPRETREFDKQLYQNPYDEKQEENIDKQDGDSIIKNDKNDPITSYSDYFHGYFTYPDSSDVPFGKNVINYGKRVRANVLNHLKRTIEQGVLDGDYNKQDTHYIQRKFHFYPSKGTFTKARKAKVHAKRYAWKHRPSYDLYGTPKHLLGDQIYKEGITSRQYHRIMNELDHGYIKKNNPRFNYYLGYNQGFSITDNGSGPMGTSYGVEVNRKHKLYYSPKQLNAYASNSLNRYYDDGYKEYIMTDSDLKDNYSKKTLTNYANKYINVLKQFNKNKNILFRKGFTDENASMFDKTYKVNKHKLNHNKEYRKGVMLDRSIAGK